MPLLSFWNSWRRSSLEKADRRKFANGFTRWLPNPLTESQIVAAVSRARETLVVAAAGSGKTTLLLGRAKYLVESGRAQPGRILALAFNKSAATELQERSEAVGVPMKAMTFHGFGNSLLNYEDRIGGVAFGDEQSLDKFFADRVSAAISLDPRGKLATFFSEMLVPVRDHSDFKTLAHYAAYAKVIPRTFSKHRVKSHGEFIIANYLFTRDIDFDYEAIYKGSKRTEWHRPDFTVHHFNNTDIYIEYFGIDGQGNTAPFINREAYNREIGLKRQSHSANGTTLIELTYQDLKDGVLIEKLERSLNQLKIPASWKSGEELLTAANEVGYVNRFVRLCRSFLSHTRARRLSSADLSGMRIKDQRTRAFVGVFSGFLADYEHELAQLGLPDFSAMIHEAADQLIGGHVPFQFDHVLVDEFQDISADRQRLLEAMKVSNPEAEFFYVGDDWQSINRFAGADIGIMRRVSRRARNRKTVRLAETHRFPQSLAEISGIFVQKNPAQLRKVIESTNPSTSSSTLYLHTGADPVRKGENLKEAIESIGSGNDGAASLLVMARYNDNLPSRHDVGRLWNGRYDIRSIHRSKGSEADYVVVVDVVQDLRGFPSTIEDDPVLALVMPEPEAYEYAEERRLFYVALTRARVACHLISPLQEPSLFTIELLEQQHGVVVGTQRLNTVRCPVCTSGVLATSSRDGGTHCSNSPYCIFRSPKCGICDQRLHATSLNPIQFGCINHSNKKFTQCPKCKWGVLVERHGPHGNFRGCSNYSVTGCKGKIASSRRTRRF